MIKNEIYWEEIEHIAWIQSYDAFDPYQEEFDDDDFSYDDMDGIRDQVYAEFRGWV